MQKDNFTTDNLQQIFAERLQYEMDQRDHSLADLSLGSGIPYSTIVGWLKKKRLPDSKNLSLLADFYGVSTDYLLGRIDEKSHDLAALYDSLGLSQEAVKSLQQFKQGDKLEGVNLVPGKIKCKALSEALASQSFLGVVASIMLLEKGKPGFYEGAVHAKGGDFYNVELSPDSMEALLCHRLQLTLNKIRTSQEPPEYAPAVERASKPVKDSLSPKKRLLETRKKMNEDIDKQLKLIEKHERGV